jgi:FimV-like protein
MRDKWTSGAVALFLTYGAGIAQDRIDEQITRARLLYTRGELQQAERSLRGVVQDGSDAQRQQARALLAQLHGEALVAAEPAAVAATGQDPQASGDDPIYALIRVLNRGSQGKEIRDARDELRSLGGLVVQHLIDTFPKLGPFGVQNVLELLRYHDDPRVTAMLQHQVENGRREVVASIAKNLGKLHMSVSRPLAKRFAEAGQPDEYRLAALGVMLKDAPESAECQQLEAALLASEDADVRGEALSIAVLAGRMEQPAALAVLNGLPQSQQAWRPLYWAAAHDDWLEVAKVGARAALSESGYAQSLRQYVDEFEWWRGDDEGMELVLRMAERSDKALQAGRVVLSRAVERGWKVPPSMDSRICELIGRTNGSQFYTFVNGLAADGEARAIAIWERYPEYRKELINAVRGLSRPWHRLMVKHLLSIANGWEIDQGIVGRDWSGASQDVIADLKRFTAKWPKMASGVSDQWMGSLATAYRSHDEIGLDVVEPQLWAGNQRVWSVVMNVDPTGVLERAAAIEELPVDVAEKLARLLYEHGRRRDLPLALRLMKLPVDAAAWDFLGSYAMMHAAGSLELLQLVANPEGLTREGRAKAAEMAHVACRGADVANLDAYLAVVPDLGLDAMQSVWRSFQGRVGPAHVDALAAALRALAEEDWKVRGRDSNGKRAALLGRGLITLLASTGTPRAVPALRAVVADRSSSDADVYLAVDALLKVAGDERNAIVAELLRSERAEAAIGALQDDGIPANRELQDLALQVVLRLAPNTRGVEVIFGRLSSEDRQRFATAVLEHPDMPRFRRDVMFAALESYAGSKDTTFLPQMKLAATHEDERVRSLAALQLGRTFTREAVEPLLDLLRDDHSTVRKSAQSSLDMIANYLEQREKWEQRFRRK